MTLHNDTNLTVYLPYVYVLLLEVIVVAVTKPEAKSRAHGISLFLVEEGMPGFKKGKKLKKLGLKAQVCL